MPRVHPRPRPRYVGGVVYYPDADQADAIATAMLPFWPAAMAVCRIYGWAIRNGQAGPYWTGTGWNRE
jgi:hypothetical protein